MNIIITESQFNKILSEKYSKENLDVINDFYPEYYKNNKNNAQTVGWFSKKDQIVRFKKLLDIGVENGDSILDFGCGLGDLYEYMNKHYDNFKYYGVDINQDFINKCKEKYPDVIFQKITDISDFKRKYDWFIASGAFTVYTPMKDMLNTIKTAFKQTKYGMAINFLEHTHAKNSDLYSIRGYDKKELYDTFLNEFKEFHTVELHDDYLENDFTIYIKKINYFN